MKNFSFKPVIFMIVITIFFTGILALIHEVTADQVLLNSEVKMEKALLYVLDISTKNKSDIEINELFNSHIKTISNDQETYYEGYKNDSLVGYVFPLEGDALWGHLEGLIGVDADYSNIIGIEFVSHNETPGLGGRIDELEFKEQFRDIAIDDTSAQDYIVFKPNPGGQVDSITGATLTSNSVKNILNKALDKIMSNKGEVQ